MDFKYYQLSSSCHIQVSYDGFHFDQNHMHFFKHVIHFNENGGQMHSVFLKTRIVEYHLNPELLQKAHRLVLARLG